MKQHLIDTFCFNDWRNKKMLSAIQKKMTDKTEAAAIFSHLITAPNRWLLSRKISA